jgi:UDP-3-O-[3-hydroxymyristoyl] glucosamine N-acyltransferase
MNKNYSLNDIYEFLPEDYSIVGNTEIGYINNAKPIELANKESIVWIKGNKNDKYKLINETLARLIICDKNLEIDETISKTKCFIVVDNPKLIFIRIIENLFIPKKGKEIHPSAIIHPDAQISPTSYIGPFTYIGNCKIGDNVIIDGNCYLYDNTTIGNNVIIHAGVVIGCDGYGYSRNEKLEFEKFPHLGGVIIHDNVEIGANAAIDRGALGDTIIGEGTKIDNLVQIAHNVVIGKHCAIIANSMLAGSVVIGDYSWVAPSASVLNQLHIGSNVTVGLGAVVNRHIPDGEVWTGVPAKPLKEYVDTQRALKKLIK